MMLPATRLKTPLLIVLLAALQIGAPSWSYAQASKTTSETKASATTEPAPPPPNPAPYDDQLARLSEIIGALQYIEVLCKVSNSHDWRSDMSKLLAAEAGNEPMRQEKLTAAFNRGYRSFAAVYTQCTENAKAADKTYRHEGATLAHEITSRFGN